MNARTELIHSLMNIRRKIKCAIVSSTDWDGTKTSLLKIGYSDKDYQDFLDSLDYNYDAGYGYKELDGTVWFEDGTWMSRAEYDGSEWWEFQIVPPIPEQLIK